MYKVYTLNEASEWLEKIKSFDDYDIYFTPQYLKPFFNNGEGKPLFFYYENEKGKVAHIFLIRDIANSTIFIDKLEKGVYFDISTVYGYGGPIFQLNKEEELEKFSDEFYKEFTEYCKASGIICEFVRFHPILNNYIFSKTNMQLNNIRKTVYMDLSQGEDIIWSNITSKNRNMIRKAQKSDIKITVGNNEFLLQEMIKLYRHTMERDNAEEYYYFNDKFFYDTLNTEDALIFAASYQDKTIAASIVLKGREFIHYHLSGADRNYMHLAPNNLLLYEIALWGSKNGFKSFHMGGGYQGADDTLFKFKKSFSKLDPLDFYIGKKIYNLDLYDYLVKTRSKFDKEFNLENNYFPLYRG